MRNDVPFGSFEEPTPPIVQSAIQKTLSRLPEREHGRNTRRLAVAMTCVVFCAVIMISPLGAVARQAVSHLFELFAADDPALVDISEQAPQAIQTPVPIRDEGKNIKAIAAMDQIYFDGESLYLSYVLRGGKQTVEQYQPTEGELASMAPQNAGMLPLFTASTAREEQQIADFYERYDKGQPAGLYIRSVNRLDHIRTTEGVDMAWHTNGEKTLGNDVIEYIEFEKPLPDEISGEESISLSMRFSITDSWFWFDGETLYTKTVVQEEYALDATAPRIVAAP